MALLDNPGTVTKAMRWPQIGELTMALRSVFLTFALASLGGALAYPLTAVAQEQAPAAEATAPAAEAAEATPAPTPAPAEAAPAPGATTVAAPADAAPAAQAPAVPKDVEEMLVTGSRLRQKDLTTPAPVTVLGKSQIQSAPKINIGDILQTLPSQGNALNTSVNNGGNGTTQVNLRSIGANRTLVLVDGKRMVYGGLGADATVDLATIPTGAIERVEVLKDGASAVYGSDAIGGVVNIITRQPFNGAEATAFEGISQRGDAETRNVDVIAGAKSDKGGFLFGAGYFDQKSFMAADRSWAKYALAYDYAETDPAKKESRGGSGSIPQGRVQLDPSACTTPLCGELAAAYGATRQYFINDPSATGGWRPYVGSTDAYNYQAVNYLVTPTQRISMFASGDYNLGDVARVYFQSTYVNRKWANMLAPEPLNQGFGVTIAADNQYNPFGTEITAFGRRLNELSGRSQATDMDTFRLVAGIDGTIGQAAGPLAGWTWDASLNYGRTAGITKSTGSLNTQIVQQGIGPSYEDATGWHCGTAASPIANCVPVNLFGGEGTITPEMAASLGAFTGIAQGWNQQFTAEGNVSGELFKLAAKQSAAIAAGYQYRYEYGGFQPNPLAVLGLDADYSSMPTSGMYHTNEVYGEFSLPIIDNTFMAEELSLDAAVRYAKYSTYGATTTYKVGGRWSPVNDVTLRGTYSTGFRAPSVSELFSGTQTSWPSAMDPCGNPNSPDTADQCGAAAGNGNDDTQQLETIGGNKNLQPEKSKMFTAGVVVQPAAVENLSVTLDYYNLAINNNLGAIGAAVIIAGCYPGPGGTPDPILCSKITRDSSTNMISDIDDVNTNLGSLKTQGIDIGVRYAYPTEFGRLGLVADANYLLALDQIVGTVKIKGKNTYDLGVNPALKINAGVSYDKDGFVVGVDTRYVGAIHECAAADGTAAGGGCYANYRDAAGELYPTHSIPAYMVYNMTAAYTFDWDNAWGKTTISGGVQNLADTNPPLIYNSFLSYADPSAYDFLGRYFYVRLAQKF